MKLTRWLILAAAVLVFGVVSLTSGPVALADTSDPAIGVRGCTGGGCSNPIGPDGTFSFTFTGTMGTTITEQTFNFFNNSGFTAAELDLFAPASLTYTCGDFGTYFTNCTVTPPNPILTSGIFAADATNETLIRYFGGGGIPSGPPPTCVSDDVQTCPANDFQMVVTSLNGDLGQIPPTESFLVNGLLIAPVPEPASIVLISTGLASIGLIKRRRSKRDKEANSVS